MFCRQGFIPLSVLRDKIPEANFNRAFEVGLEFDPLDPEYALSVTASDWLEASFFAFLGNQVYVCSSEGTTLKIDFRLLRNDYFTVRDLLQNEDSKAFFDGDLNGQLSARELFDYSVEDFVSDGLGEHESYWKGSLELGLQHKHTVVPYFHTRHTWCISMFMFDFIRRLGYAEVIDFVSVAEAIRPFEGWALCTTECHVRDSWDDYWHNDLVGRSNVSPSNRPGRPRKIEAATNDISSAFPNGVENNTYKQVANTIHNKTGRLYSVSTIRRALQQK